MRQALAVIPADASVAANTPLIPLLSHRRVLVRLPASRHWQEPGAALKAVEWVAMDLQLPAWRAAAFESDRRQVERLQQRLEELRAEGYRTVREGGGVVVLRRS